MPEQHSRSHIPSVSKRILYGVWDTAKSVPEWQTSQVMRVYDKYFLPKYISSHDAAMSRTHRKTVEKWVGRGVAGIDTAIIAFGIVKGYHALKNRLRTPHQATPAQTPIVSGAVTVDAIRPETSQLDTSLLQGRMQETNPLTRNRIGYYTGDLMDSTLPRLRKMTTEDIRDRIGLIDYAQLEHVRFMPDRIPQFFLNNLGERVFFIPDEYGREIFMIHMVADGGRLWHEFRQLHPDRNNDTVTIQNGIARFTQFNDFLQKQFNPAHTNWFDTFLQRKFSSVKEVLDTLATMTGYSFRGWVRMNDSYFMPDTVPELTEWFRFLADIKV